MRRSSSPSARRASCGIRWEPGRLLFSNPADRKTRLRMTVRMSRDEGATWTTVREFGDAPAAYSCLTALPDRTAGCLYETGVKSAYEKIVFARFPLD